MNISAIFIRRPVMTTLVMLAILIFGAAGYKVLPVSDLPNIDFPTIVVSASLPGATPETMSSAVATPLEKQFSTIAGIDSMASTSTTGGTQITLQFNLSRNIDAAAQDVQAAIAAVQRQLPPDMPSPPTYQKVNPADQPVIFIALTSPTLPLSTLDEYGQTLLAQRISMISGVAQVLVYGSQKYAVRVQLDPSALATRGIGINDVAAAIDTANVNLPTGTLYGHSRQFNVQVNGQLTSGADYMGVIVAYRNGSPVRIQDIGVAFDDVENNKTAAWYIDRRSIVLAVQRQPGSNTVQVANGVKQVLPSFSEQLPASVSMHVLYDRSESIQASVNDVKFTLVLTLCLVVLVIFLFLRNVSATVIPSLALPMSIVGTFAVMYALGYTVDNLSLMALTLSVGFVVDDAIVMLENIVRHMELGEKPFDAALTGSKEIGFTILSMTLSLTAVFIPVLFMGGIVGRIFHEFAVTIAAAILISGVVSLTLTPMLSCRFLRPSRETKHGRLYNATERGFTAARDLYAATLHASLRHRIITMAVLLFTVVGTGYLFVTMPKGFIPAEDRNFVVTFTEGAEGIAPELLFKHQQELAAIVKADPNVEAFMSSAGARGVTGGNQGILFVRLVPRAKRKLSADQWITMMRPKISVVPGMRVFMQNPPMVQIGGRLTQSQYQFTLTSGDTEALYRGGAALEGKFRALPGLLDISSDLKIRNPQVNVAIERDKASTLGVSANDIEEALYDAYGERQVSTIFAPEDTYQVIMELLPKYQLDPNALSLLYIHSTGGNLVPLSAVAKLIQGVGPMSINHSGQLPAVTLAFNLAPGVSLGTAVGEVQRVARETLPATITTSFQGSAQAFQSSVRGLGLLLFMAILVIYIVLGVLYESFLHPITILSGLPAAGFGALITLVIFHMDINIYAFVGVILLVGLVKKNGIMMVDFALDAERLEGKEPIDAIYQACIIRFRPIMMTTMSALMAGLPIAIGIGAGGEARRPLGLTIVGGLVFSQLLTLYVTPVLFVYLEWFSKWIGRKSRHFQPAAEAAAR